MSPAAAALGLLLLPRHLRRAGRRSDAPDVIYILGPARSASTVTGDLLATAEGVAHLGELRGVLGSPDRFLAGRRRCGCGEPLETCPFWSTLGPGDDHTGRADMAAVLRHAGAAGATTVVDSSKRIGPFLDLLASEAPLRGVVLCQRGLRAYLSSRWRHGRDRHNRARLLASMGPDVVRWAARRGAQVYVRAAGSAAGVPVARTSPELVAADPAGLLVGMAEAFSLPVPAVEAGDRRFDTGPQHTVWGSPTRVRPDGWLTVTELRPAGASRRRLAP